MTTQPDSKPRILLADDEPDNIRVLAAALDKEFALSFATSGKQTLEMARAEPKPDMMLVDVMMSDMDGFQVCGELHADPNTADIPVIFVTALADRINEEKGFQAGGVDYITKPISPFIVRARVKVHLELKRHQAFLGRLLERRTEDLEAAQDEVRQVLGALRESETKLRAFMDNAPQALSLKDVNGRYLIVNSVVARRIGRPVETILGKTNSELGRWDAPTRRAVDAHEQLVIDSGTAVSQERTEIENDGSIYALFVTKFPVFDDEGRVVAIGTSNTDITELKATARALSESEESFRHLIQGSIQGIVIQRDGGPLFANQAFADILGFASPEEVLTLGSLEPLIAPHERARLQAYQSARLKDEEAPAHYEFDALRKDGSPRTLQSAVSMTRWQGESAMQVAVVDVTERTRAEQALRESRERFRDFAEASSDWFWETGPDHQFKFLSGQDSRLLNVSAVKRLNLTREAGGDRDDVAAHPEKWHRLWESLEARRPFRNFEFPVQDDQGRTRYIRASGKALMDENGDFFGYRGVASDVTDVVESQRQAEALRNAIDVSEDAVVLYDKERRVVFTNDAYHRIFPQAPPKDAIIGVTREEVIRKLVLSGWMVDPLLHADPEAFIEEALRWDPDEELAAQEQTYANRRTYLRRRRVFGDGQALATFTDITQRKEIEAELRRLASEVSLAEERERRRIAAELHDGAVQKLGVSRLKLGMLCSRLAGSQDAAEGGEICDLLDRSIREVRSLMSELSSPMLYELGLEPAVEWLAQRFRARHGLDCEVELDDQAERLSSDVEVSLFQAVRELLVNIVKHAKAKKVSIGVQRSEADLRVRVQDDGIGLNPDLVGTHPSDTGGFGLFSVRERLGLLGGRMLIESDQGTRVTMTVPLATRDHGV